MISCIVKSYLNYCSYKYIDRFDYKLEHIFKVVVKLNKYFLFNF